MRVVALLRIEWIKILRRRAFWVALAADVGIVVAAGSGLYAEIIRRGAVIATLAGEWPNILQFSEIASVISAAVVVLLVGTEFSWGTARQSVINGLSRNEYFAAKLLLVPQMGLLFLLATLLAGASVVIIVANPPTIVPWFSRVDLHHVGGTALGILGCGSLAFLIAMTIRGPGPAIAVFVLYLMVERIAASILMRLEGPGDAVARHLPWTVFQGLMQRAVYASDAGAHDSVSTLASMTTYPSPGWLAAIAALYITGCIGVAFLDFRRRDL